MSFYKIFYKHYYKKTRKIRTQKKLTNAKLLSSKNVVLFFSFLMIFLNVSCSLNSKNKKTVTNFTAMDTYISIQSFGKNSAKANELAQKKVLELENLLSVTNPQSEVFFLNNNQKNWHTVNAQTFEVIDFSVQMAQLTDGAFNPCLYPILKEWGFTTNDFKIPSQKLIAQILPDTDYTNLILDSVHNAVFFPDRMMIDLGGIGKGFAGDKVLEILKQNGIESAILDFGGNIQTLGRKPDGSEWSIGVKNPLTKEITAGIKVENKAVITSGGYERYFTGSDGKKYIHILDSKSGRPADNEIASVTIISSDGKYADALSTALFVMGIEKAETFRQNNPDFEMLIFTKDGTPHISTGLQGKVDFFN